MSTFKTFVGVALAAIMLAGCDATTKSTKAEPAINPMQIMRDAAKPAEPPPTPKQSVSAEYFQLPLTQEIVIPGQPRRNAKRYGAFIWAADAIYVNRCMASSDPMRTRRLIKHDERASWFSEEEQDRAWDNAEAE